MRNPTDVLNSLSEKSKDPSYKFRRLYRNLYNPEFICLPTKYLRKRRKHDSGSRWHYHRWYGIQASRANYWLTERPYLPTQSCPPHLHRKKNNPAKQRPLGIPSGDDKLVQEVVRMILESIYEPSFSDTSHGFRPKRSCHTALLKIQNTFTGVKWFVEGDIQACFDSFDHHVLIDILRRRIEDEAFIGLMWKFLKAGYMEQWQYHMTYSGTPQGSGMSPILANIYMNELDTFMAEYKETFDRNQRITTPEYSKLRWKIFETRRKTI